jgi:hypothetical protein
MTRQENSERTKGQAKHGARKKRPRAARQDGEVPAPKRSAAPRLVDEATFYEALPTAVRKPDDPVVQAMRANPGRWIVWNEATRAVYATADDYSEALQQVVTRNDPDVKLGLAPGFHPDAPIHQPPKLLPWESPNVVDDVQLLWGDSADAWLDSPNPRFGGRKPRELVGTEDEFSLREMLRAVRYGGPP